MSNGWQRVEVEVVMRRYGELEDGGTFFDIFGDPFVSRTFARKIGASATSDDVEKRHEVIGTAKKKRSRGWGRRRGCCLANRLADVTINKGIGDVCFFFFCFYFFHHQPLTPTIADYNFAFSWAIFTVKWSDKMGLAVSLSYSLTISGSSEGSRYPSGSTFKASNWPVSDPQQQRNWRPAYAKGLPRNSAGNFSLDKRPDDGHKSLPNIQRPHPSPSSL